MRELNFRFNTSPTHNKRDVCIEETVERNGLQAKIKRRCRYFVLSKAHIEGDADLPQLSGPNMAGRHNKKRHFFVLKAHDTSTGRDRFLCKVAGLIYAVHKGDVFCIAYVHSFKISFAAAVASEGSENAS